MSTAKGDDAALRRLIEQLVRVATGELARQARAGLAEQTREEIARTFRERRSPDGSAWKPLADGGAPLVESGALRDGFDVTVTPEGARVTNPASYASVHQRGGRIRRGRGKRNRRKRRFGASGGAGAIPARPMLPTSRWGSAPTTRLRAATSRIVRLFFRR